MGAAMPRHRAARREADLANAVAERIILTSDETRRALARIAHEILERNGGGESVALIGIHTRGVALARRLAAFLREFEGVETPVGELDIGLYRDDLSGRARPALRRTRHPRRFAGPPRGHRGRRSLYRAHHPRRHGRH